MKIGYGKIGRSFDLNRGNMSTLGGDVDVLNLLERLARMYPDDEIILVGRNSGEDPQAMGLPPNVVNPWRDALKPLQADLKAVGCEVSWSRTGKSKQLSIEAQLAGLPVFKHYAEEMTKDIDAYVLWVGQHGTSNWNIPMTDGTGTLTHPQDAFYWYAGHMLYAVNQWRDRHDGRVGEAWLNPDPRNYFKGRDLKWPPLPILGQFDYEYQTKHERYGDTRDPQTLGYAGHWEHSAWTVRTQSTYNGVELTALSEPSLFPMPPLEGRTAFGMIVNENRRDVKDNRLDVLCEWILPRFESVELHGSWSKESCKILDRDITPLAHNLAMVKMGTWRSTFTTPASGSGWATAKPWEAFLTGTVCFFHPKYDVQDNILGQLNEDERPLYDWLRVKTPDQLVKRVNAVMQDDDTYLWLATTQRRFLERIFAEDQIGNTLRDRIAAQVTVTA